MSAKSKLIIIDGVFFQILKTGIGRVWISLLSEWAKNDFGKHLLILDRVGTAPKIPSLRYRKIPDYSYEKAKADKQMLQDICSQEGADLFISTYYTTPIQTPSVFVAYDMIPEVISNDLSHPMWQEKHHAIRHACAYLAISYNTAQDLIKFFPQILSTSVTVAHCGVSPLFSPASCEEIQAFKNQHRIELPYLMLSGSLGGYKNQVLLFKALSLLPTKRGFAVICTGNNRQFPPEWISFVEDIPVHLLYLNDQELRSCYSGAVALIYPSKYEGFGMPILEAMACGCPVITCNNSSLPEVAGDAAIYVNHNNPLGLAEALAEIQKPSTRKLLINRGFQRIAQFTWEKMAATFQNALYQLLAKLT